MSCFFFLQFLLFILFCFIFFCFKEGTLGFMKTGYLICNIILLMNDNFLLKILQIKISMKNRYELNLCRNFLAQLLVSLIRKFSLLPRKCLMN